MSEENKIEEDEKTEENKTGEKKPVVEKEEEGTLSTFLIYLQNLLGFGDTDKEIKLTDKNKKLEENNKKNEETIKKLYEELGKGRENIARTSEKVTKFNATLEERIKSGIKESKKLNDEQRQELNDKISKEIATIRAAELNATEDGKKVLENIRENLELFQREITGQDLYVKEKKEINKKAIPLNLNQIPGHEGKLVRK